MPISRRERAADLALYDRLGPKAKAALECVPKCPNVYQFVKRYMDSHNARALPLDSPLKDQLIADYVRAIVLREFGQPLEAYEVKRRGRVRRSNP